MDSGAKLARQRASFVSAYRSAVEGAQHISSRGEQLAPVIFWISRNGQVTIMVWASDKPARDSISVVQAEAYKRNAVAAVAVLEAVAGNDTGLMDVAVVYGTFPATGETLFTIAAIENGAWQSCDIAIAPEQLNWLDKALHAHKEDKVDGTSAES